MESRKIDVVILATVVAIALGLPAASGCGGCGHDEVVEHLTIGADVYAGALGEQVAIRGSQCKAICAEELLMDDWEGEGPDFKTNRVADCEDEGPDAEGNGHFACTIKVDRVCD